MRSRAHDALSAVAIGILTTLAVLTPVHAVTPEDVLRVLRQHGIAYDSNRVERAAVEAILHAVDPRAMILSDEDAKSLRGKTTIVSEEVLAGDLRYMKLDGLHEDGRVSVTNRFEQWLNEGCSGLILDLRGAGGGNLEAVERIAGRFAATNGILFAVRGGSNDTVRYHRATNTETTRLDAPMLVLVDGQTRDASEVLAAVLERFGGVMLVGAPTRGDNAVREAVPLCASQVVWVATRRVTLPGHGCYAPGGVSPDVVVSGAESNRVADVPPERVLGGRPLSDKAKLDRELIKRIADDPVLARAADILIGLRALGIHTDETARTTNSETAEQP